MSVATILSALAAIPSLTSFIETVAASVTLWYCQRANNQTLSAISDAAALSSAATTDDERFAAAQAWQKALSNPRVTPS
jgi:hypothetical protein